MCWHPEFSALSQAYPPAVCEALLFSFLHCLSSMLQLTSVCVCVYRWRHQVVATGLLQHVTRKMMMQMPSNSFLGHPGLQSNYQSMMIGAESQRLLPTWNYPPPPPPPPSTHTAASAGSTSVFNCLPVDRPSSNDEKSIQGQTQHHQLASSSSSSSIPFTAGHGC